jgi:hypothetical protein
MIMLWAKRCKCIYFVKKMKIYHIEAQTKT